MELSFITFQTMTKNLGQVEKGWQGGDKLDYIMMANLHGKIYTESRNK